MTAQASETIIIAGKEYKLPDNLLPEYLASHQFQIDDEKNYTAVWELKGNSLYLNAFDAFADGKPINLNDLYPDLFLNPSCMLVSGVTARIEVEIGTIESISERLEILLTTSHIVHIFHIQAQINSANNKVLPKTLARIKPQKINKLIDIISNKDSFEAKVYYAMAQGLDSHEIFEELYDLSNSMTFRLWKVMKRHPMYFMPQLCFYYPFTKEMLHKYQRCLDWDCLSENFFLDLDEDLLMEYKDKWAWELIGRYIIGVEGKLAYVDFLLKYYEIGLIDAEDILWNQIFNNSSYNYDNAFSNITCFYEEFDEISKLVSRNEALKEEMNELALERINNRYREMEEDKVWIEKFTPRSNTTQDVGFVVSTIKRELEEAIYFNYQKQPKELELEYVISLLEREGKILDGHYGWRQLNCNDIPDPFMLDNPLHNGIDYTFNTPDKRKVLDDAVQLFFAGHPLLTRIEATMDDIRRIET